MALGVLPVLGNLKEKLPKPSWEKSFWDGLTDFSKRDQTEEIQNSWPFPDISLYFEQKQVQNKNVQSKWKNSKAWLGHFMIFYQSNILSINILLYFIN